MSYHFSASRISGDGNSVFPDEIIIDDKCFTYRKQKLVGSKETKIDFNAIACVSIDKHLLFADIIIETRGGMTIRANGFSKNDAERIVELLHE